MLQQLLCAAEVTDLEGGLLVLIEESLCVDEDIVRFYVPMGDPLRVQKCQTLKELVA